LAAIRLETHGLAVLNANEGNREAARDGCLRALELARQLGDPAAEAYELRNLAGAIQAPGETGKAREYLQESLALSQRLNDPYQIGTSYSFLGRLDRQEGRTDDAIAD
jgi:tetratricopeptide (TPR) repeat protein